MIMILEDVREKMKENEKIIIRGHLSGIQAKRLWERWNT